MTSLLPSIRPSAEALLRPRNSALSYSFLLPFLSGSTAQQFSTSSVQRRRDNSRLRGLSAPRSSGLGRRRKSIPINWDELPIPNLDPSARQIETDPDHGLWGFLNPAGNYLATPVEDSNYGRSWTVEELRKKSWEDLQKLWWTCTKERNRIASERIERDKTGAGNGTFEANDREDAVRTTMKHIKHTLTERWYAWEGARKRTREDPSITWLPNGQVLYEPYKESQESASDDNFVTSDDAKR